MGCRDKAFVLYLPAPLSCPSLSLGSFQTQYVTTQVQQCPSVMCTLEEENLRGWEWMGSDTRRCELPSNLHCRQSPGPGSCTMPAEPRATACSWSSPREAVVAPVVSCFPPCYCLLLPLLFLSFYLEHRGCPERLWSILPWRYSKVF